MENRTERVGIPTESFIDLVWHGVVRTYFEVVNGHYVPPDHELEMGFYHTADKALEARDGYRFGSKLTMHSKLRIKQQALGDLSLVYFDFDPNSDPGEDARLEQYHQLTVSELTKNFRTGVDNFLTTEVAEAQQFTPRP